MISYLANYAGLWGPLRLLESYSFLFGLGFFISACLLICFLPRLWRALPVDFGKVFKRGNDFFVNIDGHEVPFAAASKPIGKPTGAGVYIFAFSLVLILLFVPALGLFDLGLFLMLFFAMLSGYLDDIATSRGHGWSGKKKGFLDLAICLIASIFVFFMLANAEHKIIVWWPFVKGEYALTFWQYIPGATFLLWFSINATNCSDGVDGLAGSLSFITLIFLAALLYLVIGNMPLSSYLLIPSTPKSALLAARWSIAFATVAGALAGYLWWNAYPSNVLMGDAGSRFIGLLLGLGVLMTGNPCLIFALAPVLLTNGGAGLVRSGVLKIEHKAKLIGKMGLNLDKFLLAGRLRFPLHDHCRENMGWSNQQVLARFILIQLFLLPLLFLLMLKVR